MKLNSEKLNSFLEKYNKLLILVIVVLIGSVGIFALLVPQFYSLSTSGVLEYKETEEKVVKRQQYLVDLQMMKRNFEELDFRIFRLIDTILPPQQESARLFEELELFFADTNIEIKSINIAAVNEPVATEATNRDTAKPYNSDDIIQLSLTVNVDATAASYEDFKDVLIKIEEYDHLLELESLVYAPENSAYTFTFITYQRSTEVEQVIDNINDDV
ncbi:MAG: hypothetical protein Q8P90_01510 [bacterium]|nr:hypothetical protein [bacterium]